MLVSNSLLRIYNSCEKAAEYKIVRRLAPNTPATPLKRGSWLHELLEAHYTGEGWRKRHKKLTKEFDKLFDEEKDYYGDLPGDCARIMRSYEYRWKEEDAGLKIIAAEDVVQVTWPHGHDFQLKFDLIVEDDYGRWLVEHKSHKTIPDDAYRFMDVQTLRYVHALNRVKVYGPIDGILWNYLRTKPPTIPTLTKTGLVARRNSISTDVLTFVGTLKKLGVDWREYRDVISRLKRNDSFFRRVRVPIQKDVMQEVIVEGVQTADRMRKGGPYVRNIGRHCSWCTYQDICIVELYGGNAKPLIKAKFHTEDPLKYHESTEEEAVV